MNPDDENFNNTTSADSAPVFDYAPAYVPARQPERTVVKADNKGVRDINAFISQKSSGQLSFRLDMAEYQRRAVIRDLQNSVDQK
jgi:hypothetical protein